LRGKLHERIGEARVNSSNRSAHSLRSLANPFSELSDGFDCVHGYSSGCTQENPFDGTDCLDNHGYDICMCQGESEFDSEACAVPVPEDGVTCAGSFGCTNFVCDEFSCTDEAFSCRQYFGACYDGDCPNGENSSFTCPHYFSCKSIGTDVAYQCGAPLSFTCQRGAQFACQGFYSCGGELAKYDCEAQKFWCGDTYTCIRPFDCSNVVNCGSCEVPLVHACVAAFGETFECASETFSPGREECEIEERFICFCTFREE
jgi:hypothetical protein